MKSTQAGSGILDLMSKDSTSPSEVKMKPIKDLFAWYEVGLKSETKYNNNPQLGAEETTRIISAAFRTCGTQTTAGSNTVAQSHLSQDDLFKRIRQNADLPHYLGRTFSES